MHETVRKGALTSSFTTNNGAALDNLDGADNAFNNAEPRATTFTEPAAPPSLLSASKWTSPTARTTVL